MWRTPVLNDALNPKHRVKGCFDVDSAPKTEIKKGASQFSARGWSRFAPKNRGLVTRQLIRRHWQCSPTGVVWKHWFGSGVYEDSLLSIRTRNSIEESRNVWSMPGWKRRGEMLNTDLQTEDLHISSKQPVCSYHLNGPSMALASLWPGPKTSMELYGHLKTLEIIQLWKKNTSLVWIWGPLPGLFACVRAF